MLQVTRNKKAYNEFSLKGKLTAGKLMALRTALENYKSPLAEELFEELNRATHDENGKDLLDIFNG